MISARSWFRSLLLLLTIGAAALLAAHPATADEDKLVVPVTEAYAGQTYSGWAAAWWQWAFHLPATPDHPIFPGGNTLQAQSGRVWFIAGVFGTEVRQISVPSGIALFFPVANAECSILEPPPFHGDDATSLAACANAFFETSSGLSVKIDGKSVKNLDEFRTQSPMFTIGPLPDPNIAGVAPGAVTQSSDAGVYLLVKPLKPGKHTIQIKASIGGGSIDTIYKITVTP
jgi:hypothetical protein